MCIVKILEESGEIKTRHGKLAIGILVMQDIFAVSIFSHCHWKNTFDLGASTNFVVFIKPLWAKVLDTVGHGELLILSGFILAFGGYELFELVGIKGDLGALVIGMFVASHHKSAELSKSLMTFKDLFLIGFFLTIGLSQLPTIELTVMALLLCLLIPLKFVLFFRLFTLLKLRARTSYLASLVLSNYSEFGLIVIALLVSLGWLTADWLVIMAMALSFSFVITSFAYKTSHNQYHSLKQRLKYYEHPDVLAEDTYRQPTQAEIIVIGLGRVGKGAYASTALNGRQQSLGHGR
ncbi:cation:proton antiporter [Paraglaciecola aquimarina]|uniref:Cation:proton antiporter n=1 Tax=Paraglaciecola aquimarina TaxID=1235557 RepID=A0ABU3SYM3_9ALTE|nr:cation:proton antiporter [Paraglaciecola aquimarina]MDU0355100.1 cation:proton antiporter [Paraglaciecola aquimarina]